MKCNVILLIFIFVPSFRVLGICLASFCILYIYINKNHNIVGWVHCALSSYSSWYQSGYDPALFSSLSPGKVRHHRHGSWLLCLPYFLLSDTVLLKQVRVWCALRNTDSGACIHALSFADLCAFQLWCVSFMYHLLVVRTNWPHFCLTCRTLPFMFLTSFYYSNVHLCGTHALMNFGFLLSDLKFDHCSPFVKWLQ